MMARSQPTVRSERTRPIQVPDDAAWKDLEETLGLRLKDSEILRDYVTRIVDTIQADELGRARQPDRKVRLRELRSIIKSFDDLARSMQTPLFTAPATRSALVGKLSPFLSMEAYDRLVGGRLSWYVRKEDAEAYGRTHGPDDTFNARAFEAATRLQRWNIAHAEGPALFESLLAELREPFDRLLRLERSRRGGRPRDHRRDFVIAELARVMPNPTGSPAGPFVRLCEAVLMAIGLSETGIDKAVQSFLKRRKPPEPGPSKQFAVLDPVTRERIAIIIRPANAPPEVEGGIVVPLDDPAV
jgi:hypothetical protein